MEVKLDFLTPLWTADATGKARHIEGTGLMGSLRWWYEALIRGLGGWACDPSTDSRCLLDAKAFGKRLDQGCTHEGKGHLCPNCEAKALADCGLCPACQVFGATGWARVFRLRVDGETRWEYPPTAQEDGSKKATQPGKKIEVKAPPCRDPYPFYPGMPGAVVLHLFPRRSQDNEAIPLILGLLEFIQRNAALGAKTSIGYGVFAWAERPTDVPSAQEFAEMIVARASKGRQGSSKVWPDLTKMFFARVPLKKAWAPEDWVRFKCTMRRLFRAGEKIEKLVSDNGIRATLRYAFMGTTKGQARACKIKMALLPDRRTLRVWGWVPDDLPGVVGRDAVIQLIYELVGNEKDTQCKNEFRWKEFHSARDKENEKASPEEYLCDLMED